MVVMVVVTRCIGDDHGSGGGGQPVAVWCLAAMVAADGGPGQRCWSWRCVGGDLVAVLATVTIGHRQNHSVLESAQDKREIYGKRFQAPVGGSTAEASGSDKRQDKDIEAVFHFTYPQELYEVYRVYLFACLMMNYFAILFCFTYD